MSPTPIPALGRRQSAVTSLIPVIQTREMESVLRVQSGQIAVLGGLMQDSRQQHRGRAFPGVTQIPGLGELLAQRKDLNQKTELVIFLRADGDPRRRASTATTPRFRDLLPGSGFLPQAQPEPARRGRTTARLT